MQSWWNVKLQGACDAIFGTEWSHKASGHFVWVDSCAACLTGAPVTVYATEK